MTIQCMGEYLRIALKMEQNAYALTKSINVLNNKIFQLDNELKNCKKQISSSKTKLKYNSQGNYFFNYFFDYLFCHGKQVAIVIAFLVFGIIFIYGTKDKALAAIMFFSIPALIIIHQISDARRRAKSDYNQIKSQNNKLIADANDFINNAPRLRDIYTKNLRDLQVILAKQKQDLNRHYSANVLPAKYRNLIAVGSMYEYLYTGRCTTIAGHGGMYDTFEHDRQMNEANRKLGTIIEQNQIIIEQNMQIIANTELIYSAVCRCNDTANQILAECQSIASSNRAIAACGVAAVSELGKMQYDLSMMRWSMY